MPAPARNDLDDLLRDARPSAREIAKPRAEAEGRRVKAVQALLAMARGALKAGEAGAVPAELTRFLAAAGIRVLLADDPVRALRQWLGQRRGRGTASDKERHELKIAAKVVQRLRDNGVSIDAACEAVANEPGVRVGADRARKIYLSRRDELLLRNVTLAEFDRLA